MCEMCTLCVIFIDVVTIDQARSIANCCLHIEILVPQVDSLLNWTIQKSIFYVRLIEIKISDKLFIKK